MTRNFSIVAIVAILAFVLVGGGSVQAKKQTFEEICLDVLETLQSFYPVRSTEVGIHAYDHRFTDYSSKSVKQMIRKLTDFEKKLYKYRNANLTPYQKLNLHLIKANVDIALLDLKKISWYKKSPQLYADEAVNGLYFLMLSNHAPLSERVVSIIARMKAVPKLMATAKKRISKPPPILVEAAQETLESGIDFYHEVAGELMNKFPERADNILKVSTAAREAMNDFSLWLAEVTPGADNSFAIGKVDFDYMLLHEYYLPFDSDSLLLLGEQLFAEADSSYREYEQYVETNYQNGMDSVYVPINITKEDIIAYYNWETEQLKVFLQQHDILTIPEDIAPISVIETPPFLRSMIPGIAYQPAGAFDSIQQGYFYVRPIPDDLDRRQLEARFRYIHRRGFKGSAVHEAFPGYHLQLQIAGRHVDPVRKWQFNIMFIEGWALYCEQMMYEQGLYGEENPAIWLSILGGIRFRAARIIVDVKLHTGQFTPKEAVDWMIMALNVTSETGQEYIRKEVRRYTHTPTYQMAYLIGKREIMNMRMAAEKRDGDQFSLKAFHDRLLSEGSVPPILLWDVLDLDSGSENVVSDR